MTEYGERLADDLKDTDFMDHIKTSQINWIGKSEGVQVDFDIVGGGKFSIFTTCIETIYGITFMVVAPESKLVDELRPRIKNWSDVEAYRKATAKKSEFDRSQMNKDKSGCKLEGIMAINPVNGKEVPVYLGDFVIASYGTGAVMAVPTHDQRDYEFADKYGIEKIQVIEGDVSKQAFEKTEYLGKGCKLMNSEEFTGLTVEEAKVAITDKLVKMGVAEKKLNFKMRDWIFSRQRYWGEPIPMIHCDKCGWVPVPDKDLPVNLPAVENYEPTKDGESPLSLIPDWVNTTCPCCGAPARRETDTMPGWAGSSWYFMRYCDAHNTEEFASKEALASWLPIDLYNGGNEHTTRHLLYARFWNKFLYDIGVSPVHEPFKRRVSQGIILGNDGKKMSKSAGNGVDPLVVVEEYSADALRLWMSFIGDYFETATWNDDGVKACKKFLNRVENLQDILVEGDEYSKDLEVALHTAIKKVSQDIDNIKFNTAISALMILLNEITKVGKINHAEFKTVLTLLNPFAPHMTEELWTNNNFAPSIKDAKWPEWNEDKLVKDEIEYAVQINNKIIARNHYSATASNEEIENLVREDSEIATALNGKQIVKVIVIKNRLVNIIAK
jgi:leucyl-tRNA synthetase